MLGIGFMLAALAAYFFFDSVRLESHGSGIIGRAMGRGRGGGGGGGSTVSFGILFVPFVISVIALFYDASKKWPWILLFVSLIILAIEFLSGMRPKINMKSSTLLLMMTIFGAGVAMMLRSLRDFSRIGGTQDGIGAEEDRTYLEAPLPPKERGRDRKDR